MNDSQDNLPPSFGIVDFDAEHGLFYIDTGRGHTCRLTLVGRTERGYPRRELATIPGSLWKQIATIVQNELLRGMDPEEQGSTPPRFKSGDNALSPLIARELSVLIWALMEDNEGSHLDALVAGWRQLAREERWWLYARASNPAQQIGHGWRRALYYALTDPADTRTAPRLLDVAEVASGSKKNSGAKPIGSNGTLKANQNAAKSTSSKKGLPAKLKTPAQVKKKPATKKPATKKSVTKKSVTKKSATKKSATKKSATKKSATKKSATKKSAAKKSAAKKSATKKPAKKKQRRSKEVATMRRTTKRTTLQ